MRVSVAIAALNEGLDLEATIALLDASKTRPCEVIVYDDGSVVPVEDRLAKWSPWCRVMRSDRRLGSGPAKHLAAVFSHNFRTSLTDHANPQRPGYAFPQEGAEALAAFMHEFVRRHG